MRRIKEYRVFTVFGNDVSQLNAAGVEGWYVVGIIQPTQYSGGSYEVLLERNIEVFDAPV